MKSGEALKAAYRTEEQRRRAYDKKVAKLKAELAPGSDLTFGQLADVQPTLKAAFYENEARRAAA